MAQNGHSRELHRALQRSVGALAGVAWMSALVNVLTLTGSFFMLEVQDRDELLHHRDHRARERSGFRDKAAERVEARARNARRELHRNR